MIQIIRIPQTPFFQVMENNQDVTDKYLDLIKLDYPSAHKVKQGFKVSGINTNGLEVQLERDLQQRLNQPA